ncbi:MAG: GDSL-type esterase/lipase family protein [Roseococcus sp.]|nr:GDSL-type esterase/lipase family protein [Roseococcus sp.]
MTPRRRLSALLGGLLAAQGAISPAPACPAPRPAGLLPPEALPMAHPWPEWMDFVNALSAQLRTADVARVQLVFLGDSLLFAFTPELFSHFYGHRRALNLAIPGDTTATLLWRLERGHWPAALRPRLVVLLIGTNNAARDARPENTAQGIVQIMHDIRRRSPHSRILLLALLPRGADGNDAARAANDQVNDLLRSCADGQRVFWLDPGRALLNGEGQLPLLFAYDRLHLTPLGYAVLAAGMEGAIRQLLGER